jgi:hypothetical protein
MDNNTIEDVTSNKYSQEEIATRTKQITRLVISCFWFVIINIFLYILDYSTDKTIDWAYWVTFGWGIGVLSQFLSIVITPYIESKVSESMKK